MASDGERQLLGPWMTTALVVGGVIGAGIFMLPVSLAPYGANAIVGWVISGAGAVCLAFSLARLARDGGHGIQAYIEREFGPMVAFLATFAFWVSVWAANAAVAIAAASATARIIPALASDRAVALTAMGFIAFLSLTNALGARSTGRVAVLTTVLKVLPLVAVLLILGQTTVGGQSLEPLAAMPLTLDNIAAATALTLYALLGFETAVAPVDKIRNARRNIPLALIAGTAFVALIYLASSTALLWLLPADAVAASGSPFADVIGQAWGENGALFAAFGIAVAGFGYINGGVMVAGELGYSMAVRRELPTFFARTVHGNTPVNSQLLGSALSILLVAANVTKSTAGLFTFIALLTTSATLWLYLAAALAALKQGAAGWPKIIIVCGLLFTLFAFFGSGIEANVWSVALLVSGYLLYSFMRSRSGSSPEVAEHPAAPAE